VVSTETHQGNLQILDLIAWANFLMLLNPERICVVAWAGDNP